MLFCVHFRFLQKVCKGKHFMAVCETIFIGNSCNNILLFELFTSVREIKNVFQLNIQTLY